MYRNIHAFSCLALCHYTGNKESHVIAITAYRTVIDTRMKTMYSAHIQVINFLHRLSLRELLIVHMKITLQMALRQIRMRLFFHGDVTLVLSVLSVLSVLTHCKTECAAEHIEHIALS